MNSKKICPIVLTAVMVFFFLAVMPVSAEVIELWNRTYDSGFPDIALGVATDASGNVIVTGVSDDGLTYITYNYYTIKYDPDGTELWNRTYDSGGSYDIAFGVATDASGNVIVTGVSDDRHTCITYNYYTIKYDPDGTELWNRTYDSGFDDIAFGVATDASGNVIVTGVSDVALLPLDSNYYTIKYDPDGNELWNRTYYGGSNDYASGVATDASGNVIVTGVSDYSVTYNYYTIKYDPDGTELWNRTYDSGFHDIASGVATDASGNVIVTGGVTGNLILGLTRGVAIDYLPDQCTIKYDPDGNELWNRTYGSGSDDYASGVATDASGNVIVTGVSDYSVTYNYYTIKYDPDGNELWNRTYDGGSYDYASGVATDGYGNVIVTGASYDGSDYNYYTIKYAQPEGAIQTLIDQVNDLNLQQGIDNSLDAKLEAATNALQDINENNDVAAINALEAFINAVEAQRGNKIPEDEADELIAATQEIIALLTGT